MTRFILTVPLVAALLALGGCVTTNPPSNLTTASGEAISPLCFMAGESTGPGKIINPAQCDAGIVADDAAYYESRTADQDGFTGTIYRYEDDDPASPVRSFIEYKWLGKVASGQHAVLVRESGGGSGFFSSLFLLSPAGNGAFKLDDIVAAGDRCMGGIAKASVNRAKNLIYAVNLTPQAILDLVTPQTGETVSPAVLPDCAACCYATARFNDDELLSVRLNDDRAMMAETQTADGQKTVAGCFDQLSRLYEENGLASMDQPALEDFVTQFRKVCLSRNQP
ncbi:MAG: hypothetical protein H6869_09090 [Rhodospirillales bacterium]|nr:hypothetical protein [Rhodospirillales bacterium]